jgi:hypothetical protein
MPETYKSFGTIIGTTANTTLYSGVTGTAIINSVVFSNIGPTAGLSVSLEAVKGSTAYSLITNALVPINTSLQALDAPIVLESNNTLRARVVDFPNLHAFVSVLEIT